MRLASNRVIFVGGVHGVGKSHFSKLLAEKFGSMHLSASSLINTVTQLGKSKVVNDIKGNQGALLEALSRLDVQSQYIVLDGHFCLIAPRNHIQPVPIRTFEAIHPSGLIVISDDPRTIRDRLLQRDKSDLEEQFISALQTEELRWAKKVSQKLAVPLIALASPTSSDLARLDLSSMFTAK